MSTKLKPDQPTPPLSLPLVGGGRFDLDRETPENFTMIVVYRGHHCPVCKKYLTQLAGLREQYEAAGFGVVAVSMNGQTLAEQTHGEWELGSLRVAYGLTVDMARDWGLWVSQGFQAGGARHFCGARPVLGPPRTAASTSWTLPICRGRGPILRTCCRGCPTRWRTTTPREAPTRADCPTGRRLSPPTTPAEMPRRRNGGPRTRITVQGRTS